jgi:ABC-type ATPase with predicted acetyltransferase domain
MAMSGVGKTHADEPGGQELDFGQPVYDADGERLGTIRAFDDRGFYVSAGEGVVPLDEHAATGKSGEAELMWRCWECGEMGRIAEIPELCPACGASRESIYYWTED